MNKISFFHELHQIKVLQTYIDGELVFDAANDQPLHMETDKNETNH